MQEHIRRAHPEHYISKLPATEESFQLMITTPPSERAPPPPTSNVNQLGRYPDVRCYCDTADIVKGYGNDRNSYYGEDSSPGTPRNLEEYHSNSMLPAASAAAALAQLHNHKLETDLESEGVSHVCSAYHARVQRLIMTRAGCRIRKHTTKPCGIRLSSLPYRQTILSLPATHSLILTPTEGENFFLQCSPLLLPGARPHFLQSRDTQHKIGQGNSLSRNEPVNRNTGGKNLEGKTRNCDE